MDYYLYNKKNMVTEGENDEAIKERLKDISEHIPTIVQKAEEKKFKDIINNN